MQNIKKILIVILCVVILIVILFAAYFIFFRYTANYSIVYLTSGDIYVGKLSTFPKMELSDVYLLLNVKDANDPTKSNFQLSPVKESIWGGSKIYLNEKQVLFYAAINDNSRIGETIRSR